MSEQYDNISIVMVNTSHAGNIGAAARAMKNMGLSKLVLVEPRDFPADKATWRAASASDVLESARVVSTLDEAIDDCGLVIGTSARGRRIPWPLMTPRECGDRVWAESAQHKTAIVFGREDRGLTNEELHKCNYHVHIPSNPDYSSLNIGAAIQVICYEIRMTALAVQEGKPIHFDEWDVPPANHKALEYYYEHLEQTLMELGFFDASNPRQTVTRLRRLFNRARIDEMELSIMRGMLTSIQNFIYYGGKKQDNHKKLNDASDEKKPS